MNPTLHTCANVFEHSEQVRRKAAQVGEDHGCSAAELLLLDDLALAHDIGKLRGHPHAEHSIAILEELGEDDARFLALIKYHDTALAWFRNTQGGSPPTDAAWQSLADKLDLFLLCLFMVADRIDSPHGWDKNPPTVWFLNEVVSRHLIRRPLRFNAETEGNPVPPKSA